MARVEPHLLSRRRPNGPEQLAALRASVQASAVARPGVYRMLAEDGAVLYVGKSKRVRARLLGYFRAGKGDKATRILRQTHRIEWDYAPSEFAALREELRLIKRFRPPFNVAQKRDRQHYAFIRVTGGAVPKLAVARSRATGDGLCYGPFVGPEIAAQAVRELSDALGLRDCADHVPMVYSDQPELIPLGVRAPGCIRYEIRKDRKSVV